MNENEKLQLLYKQTNIVSLPDVLKQFLEEKIRSLRLSFQEGKFLIDASCDLHMWQEEGLMAIWPSMGLDDDRSLDLSKNKIMAFVHRHYDFVRNKKKSYQQFVPDQRPQASYRFVEAPLDSKILGRCPVAGEKTRCCNLWTMDVFRNCGFDCSYCCIQSYFHHDVIIFEKQVKKKLEGLSLDPKEIYHIGTGQSSDSLMWGNYGGALEDLIAFTTEHPNVILELKTKSARVEELLDLNIPKNMITTWTLNTPTIIKNEERQTASLDERLLAARKIADQNRLVGFHFHPMIWYEGWESEYRAVFKQILDMFKPSELAMISFGTLTYIKPVIRKLRQRLIASKVLQMPLVDVCGKLSYPKEIKLELFKMAYDYFSPWHDQVFFYLCMEEIDLWESVFGFEYPDNPYFEKRMKDFYMKKIKYLP